MALAATKPSPARSRTLRGSRSGWKAKSNLAAAYESGGDPGRAIPLYEQTLTDYRRILGPDHPDTLTSASNLAGAYQAGGDLGRAIPLYEQTLTDTRRILGPDHVTVAVVLFRLAGIQLALGDATAAVRCIQRAIGIDQNAYGDDHPEIATDLVRGPRRSRAGRWGFCGRPHEPTQGT